MAERRIVRCRPMRKVSYGPSLNSRKSCLGKLGGRACHTTSPTAVIVTMPGPRCVHNAAGSLTDLVPVTAGGSRSPDDEAARWTNGRHYLAV